MYEHNALGYWSGLALCLTKVRSSRARCPVTALIYKKILLANRIAPDDSSASIWGCTVCLCPTKRTPGLNELRCF